MPKGIPQPLQPNQCTKIARQLNGISSVKEYRLEIVKVDWKSLNWKQIAKRIVRRVETQKKKMKD